MNMDKNIRKLYTASVDDSIDGVVSISIVGEPANGGRFHVVEDKEDSILVAAPILVANQLIYRNNESYGEHYIVFLPDVIRSAEERATEQKTTYVFDVEHSGEKIDGVLMVQSFIVDRKAGISGYSGLYGLTDGSWVGLFRVTDRGIIDGIKEGRYRGVSVSMYATYEEVALKDAIDMYNYLMK